MREYIIVLSNWTIDLYCHIQINNVVYSIRYEVLLCLIILQFLYNCFKYILLFVNFICLLSWRTCKLAYRGGGALGFSVLAIFYVGFSVFNLKNFGFPVLMSVAVCGFSFFWACGFRFSAKIHQAVIRIGICHSFLFFPPPKCACLM